MADRVAPYAELVRVQLQQSPDGLTIEDLKARLRLSERLVRDGVERLMYLKQVVVLRKLEPGRRGTSPFTYSLIPTPTAQ